MRYFVDLSDYQSGLNIDTVAASVHGVWTKCGDWAWVVRYGWPADYVHDQVFARFTQLDQPVGSYLFVRPGMSDPMAQIDGWRQHAPIGTTVPMIDLEASSISGGSLQAWIEEAIYLTNDRFETPHCVLYSSASFFSAYGISAPAEPHVPMTAEYHRGYTTALWQNRDSWEDWAYSAFGGPDVPAGYNLGSRDLIWQFTSSAQIPGFLGLVDCDLIPDAAFDLITGVSAPTDDIEAIMADPQLVADLKEFIRQFGPGGPYYLADAYNNAREAYKATNVAQYGWTRLDGSPITDLALWILDKHERMTAQSLNPLKATTDATQAEVLSLAEAVAKLGNGNVDTSDLAKQLAVELAPLLNLDVDQVAQATAKLFGIHLLSAPGSTTGSGPMPPAPPVPPRPPVTPPVAPESPEAPTEAPEPAGDVQGTPEGMSLPSDDITLLSGFVGRLLDPHQGVGARVADDLSKMGKVASGHEPTPEEIGQAAQRYVAEEINRAAEQSKESVHPSLLVPYPGTETDPQDRQLHEGGLS